MTATVGLYTELIHDRDGDYRMMMNGKVNTVVVYQPDANKVWKVWERIKNHPDPKIILRVWDWDDGRRYEGDPGVYKFLKERPVEYGKEIVQKFDGLIRDMHAWAAREKKSFPRRDQILCHLINEPDTNIYEKEIVLFTNSAIDKADTLEEKIYLLCFNFGTGHPAKQVAGPGSDPDWKPFWGTISKIRSGNHYVGLHEYYNNEGIRDPDMNPWHVMRHKMGTAQEALSGTKVIIAEFGLEMLVNNAGPNHHGWLGIIPAEQFGRSDLYYYAHNVADYVGRVVIFANDLSDRVWKTFDSLPAEQYVVPTMLELWKEISDDGGTPPPIPPEPPSTELLWPCDGQLTQRFGVETGTSLGKHNGIDIGNSEGTLVVAVADGIVEWVDVDTAGYGNYVRVWHPALNFHSFYAHLKEAVVSRGSSVKAGQAVGRMGSTGNSTGSHLHFEIRFGGRYDYWDVSEGYGKGRANPEAVYASYGLRW